MFNLDNIDCPEAWDCPLVLTSPRSLAACRLVGVKPVELVPSDILELAEALGSSGLANLADLRDRLEQRRLAKLEHCRAVRGYLISQGANDEHHLLTTHKYNKDVGNLSGDDLSPLPLGRQNGPRSDFNDFSNHCSVSLRRRENQFSDRKCKLGMGNRAHAERRKSLPSTTEFSARPCSRGRPVSYTDRPVLGDCFDRVNCSQRSLQNEWFLSTRRVPASSPPPLPPHAPPPPPPPPKQRQRRYSKQCSVTPLSDNLGSSCDPPPSPSSPPLGNGRAFQISTRTSDKQAKGDNATFSGHSQHIAEPVNDCNQSLAAIISERLSESNKMPDSTAKMCKSARTTSLQTYRLEQVRQRPQNPRRRSRSRSSAAVQRARESPVPSVATSVAPSVAPSVGAPTPLPPRPYSVLAGLKCPSEAGFRDRSTKCLSQQVRCSTLQYFACRSKIASLGAQWRRTAEAVGLSEEDHKILFLIEKRGVEKRAEEMSAEAARILWEREEEQRVKLQKWEEERRKLELAQRRNEDKAETKRRLASLERNFNREQRHLAERLRRRDEDAQQRLHKIALQKEAIRAEKKAMDLARQAAVEKRLRHLNQELGRCDSVLAERRGTPVRNVAEAQEWWSRSATGRQMTSASLLVLSSTGTGSPKQCVLRKRPSSAPGPTSATSDPRVVSARMIRDAIDRNLAARRLRSFVQSEAAVRAASSRASATVKARSTRARITWTRRRAAQLAMAARLRAARGAAVARLRGRIRAGERKIAALLATKERSVASSRATAAIAAQLRHNLRGTLSTTTFDRMAAEVKHFLRIPSSHSNSRLLTPDHYSHIKLQ